MITAVKDYFATLCDEVGSGWNRFWYTPADPLPLCLLRILVGIAALYFQLSYSADLVRWFGPHGLLPVQTAQQLASGGDAAPAGVPPSAYLFSYFNYVQSPTELWILHLAGAAVLVLFTAGLWTRWTSILALVVVLSYIHRGPQIAGQMEPVLAFLMLYLCLAPAGQYLSLDAHFRKKRTAGAGEPAAGSSWLSGVSLRLIQVHLSALYVMTGLTMMFGDVWWTGIAGWWLIAHRESRLVDLTFLHRWPFAINAWTHGVVWFQLFYGLLIWKPLARPLLIATSVLIWGSVALVTGLVGYAAVMLIANVAFVSPELLKSCCGRCCSAAESKPAGAKK